MRQEIGGNRRFTRTALAVMVELALHGMAVAQADPAPAATADEPRSDHAAEQVVVTGARASLLRARNLKRDASIVQDSISAEDLGRFPDDNVADSLSHVTGITISRTHGGEGQYVNVRGLGPNYSIVTLNGRILATDGDGREFAFDVLPSETIFGADVMKSAQASALEGSIGGAVNLRSARASLSPGQQASLRVDGHYNDLSRFKGGKVSALYSNTFDDKRIGLLLSGVYAKSKVRSDSLLDFSYNASSPGQFDANGDGTIGDDERNLLGACCVAFGSVMQEKERASLSGALEWKPAPGLDFTLDWLKTRLDAPAIGYHQAYYVEHAENRWTSVTIRDRLVTGMTVDALTPEVVTNTEHRVVDTDQLGLNARWKPSASLTLAGDAYYSRSVRKSGGKNSWVVAGIPGHHVGRLRMNDDALPDIEVTLQDGRDLAAAGGQLGNADYALHWAELGGTDIDDKVNGASFDGQWSLQQGVLDGLKFGLASTRRAKRRSTLDNLDHACQYCGYHYTFSQLGAGVVRPLTLPDFMRNAGGRFPTSFVQFDVPAYFEALKALDGVEILDENGQGTGSFYDSSLMQPVFSPTKSYHVTEDTLAAYLQADFAGERWSGNAGLRWVHTKTVSKSAVNRIVAIDDPTPNDPTSSPNVTYSPAEPVESSGSYGKLLPSFNLAYELQRGLMARFAAAKVMARPSLDQLAPTRVDYAYDRNFFIEVRGDAQLKPVQATQADLSLEWYYGRQSLLSGAVFWKDIKNFVTYQLDENVDIGVPGFPFSVSHPVNGDKAKVRGLEFNLQHLFDNGFGINLKYTRTGTKAYMGGVHVGELEGVSKSAASLALLYEDQRWKAQLAVDYSGRYTEALDAVAGLSRYGEPVTWVTASLAYAPTPDITVFLEGKNLTDAVYRANLGRPDASAGFETWGRTYTAGLGIKF
ncbi:MAG: TonB-dependent receptor [Pseudomonadota bacterium]